MRTYILRGELIPKKIASLISKIELCKSNKITIYLFSHGGWESCATIFSDFTQRTKKKIELVAVSEVSSAALDLFIKSKASKSIKEGTIAEVHLFTAELEYRNLLNKNSYDSAIKKSLQDENEKRLVLYDYIFELTHKEKSLIKNGGDLIIDYKRFKRAVKRFPKHY